MAGKYQSCREPVMNQTNKSFSFDLWEIVTEMHTWHRIDQITNLSILLVALSFLCEIWQCPEKNCECSSSPVFQIQISTDSVVHNRGLHSHRNADIYEIRPIQGSTPICILSKIKIKVLYRCQLIKKNTICQSTWTLIIQHYSRRCGDLSLDSSQRIVKWTTYRQNGSESIAKGLVIFNLGMLVLFHFPMKSICGDHL